MKRATVHDVAAEANASLATVDRVLNGRKGVSPGMVKRVREAAERLAYRRDILAANLATSRHYRFTFVLPSADASSFYGTVHAEVARQAAALAAERVVVSKRAYAPFNESELVECLDEICEEECDGVAVVAVDGPRARDVIDRLAARGIAVVTLVSDALRARRVQYIGIDNNAAGRVAATLIGRFIGRPEAKIGVVLGSLAVRDHVERRLGFSQVMARDFPEFEILPPVIGNDDSHVTVAAVRDVLRAHPDLAGLYSVGGGKIGIIRALEESGRASEVVTVAHELVPHSRAALLCGTFDAVIHQDVTHEVERAVRILKAASDQDNGFASPPIGINIYLRDNLP